MTLFDLMAREHRRIETELAACMAAPQSSRLKGADVAAARSAADHLHAQSRVLYPALIALDVDRAEEPALRHERMTAQARAALSRCRSGDARAAARALRELHGLWGAHGAYEQGRLRAICARLFSSEELRQLAGELRLAVRAGSDTPGCRGLRQAARAWQWRLLQRLSGGRAVPMLRDAVFVYRAS